MVTLVRPRPKTAPESALDDCPGHLLRHIPYETALGSEKALAAADDFYRIPVVLVLRISFEF